MAYMKTTQQLLIILHILHQIVSQTDVTSSVYSSDEENISKPYGSPLGDYKPRSAARGPLQGIQRHLEPINVRIPTVACPTLFKYDYTREQGFHGYLTIPKRGDRNLFDVEINMTISRLVFHGDSIKLKLLSSAEEVHNSPYLRWTVSFPYQDLLPKLVQVKINKEIVCADIPDPLRKDETRTSMWSRSVVGIKNNKDLHYSQYHPPNMMPIMPTAPSPWATTKPPQQKNQTSGILSGIAKAISNIFNVKLNGSISGGYSANVGSAYSQGGGKISGGFMGHPLQGFGGGLQGVVYGNHGFGNYGYMNAASAGLGGTLTGAGVNYGGGFGSVLVPYQQYQPEWP